MNIIFWCITSNISLLHSFWYFLKLLPFPYELLCSGPGQRLSFSSLSHTSNSLLWSDRLLHHAAVSQILASRRSSSLRRLSYSWITVRSWREGINLKYTSHFGGTQTDLAWIQINILHEDCTITIHKVIKQPLLTKQNTYYTSIHNTEKKGHFYM
jgi:hypothetical protein